MKPFIEVLRAASEQLRIPEPSRSRVLLEMAADLQDSYESYLSQGVEESEAARRAQETFGISEEALKHLARIHDSSVDRTGMRISEHVGTVWEKLLLVVLLAFEIVVAVQVLSSKMLLVYPSPFLWPIVGLAGAAFLFTLRKLFETFSSSGTDVRKLRSGLGLLLFCSGASLAVSVCGLLFHLQRFFRLNADTAPESLFVNFAGWMVGISSMMTIGLLTCVLTALFWFLLSSLIARSEARQIAAMLQAEA